MAKNLSIEQSVQTKSQPIIQAQELTREIETGETTLTILKEISLQVSAGESIAVVGASGSGKSTLLGLLAGLDEPTQGTVFLDGQDIFKLDEDERAVLRGRLLGFMFQSFQLLPALTALENVMLPLELSGESQARDAAVNWLTRVGLEKRAKHYPRQLSGGEQQRVAIARAFVTQPKLLFADEPTGNLDAATGSQIIDLMFELNREQGTTLVLVTHDEKLTERCARIVKLEAGRMVSHS
ncbi:ABC transporter ATP-binding protein [Nitrosomonas mobilis]|uniref:Putative transporter subunit: ATP-binding component of ABC superfamily n=1 Tax=Nitrosomonas mobilis TaxID=51642 RepID=A0A1G5SI49_9PROT|nr:ABC transporter ATP-binding protein [Nitrosomonas mobilis]SCZ86667.1 putative transporter subunit: ATP-binding component of ABC superfamily [Nitrosomonas mobilis]HNO74863.1 ABC transporter ATP-binding protein [Nitrosomonas mobilis]